MLLASLNSRALSRSVLRGRLPVARRPPVVCLATFTGSVVRSSVTDGSCLGGGAEAGRSMGAVGGLRLEARASCVHGITPRSTESCTSSICLA